MKQIDMENLSNDEKMMIISLLGLEPTSKEIVDLLIRRLKIIQDFNLTECEKSKQNLWVILTENLSIKIN